MNLWIILLLLIVFIAILTTSRRGALIFSILGVFSLICFVKRYSLIKILISILLVFTFVLLIYHIASICGIELSIFDRFNMEDVDFSDYNSVNELSSSRLSLIVHAYNYFLESPVIGHGFKFFYNERGQDVHNTFLQLLCESGIVGTILILWFIFYNLIKTFYMIKRSAYMADSILLSYYMQFVFFSMFFIENPLSDRFCFLTYMIAISFLYNRMLNMKIDYNR